MKRLPNGLTVFNATPHIIRFQCPTCNGTGKCGPGCTGDGRCYCGGAGCPNCDGDQVALGYIEIEPDEIISASVKEEQVGSQPCSGGDVQLVSTVFSPTQEGENIIRQAQQAGADVIVGSIIAARAYPEQVVAMTPAPGYERVPPEEKRMNPHKFTIF